MYKQHSNYTIIIIGLTVYLINIQLLWQTVICENYNKYPNLPFSTPCFFPQRHKRVFPYPYLKSTAFYAIIGQHPQIIYTIGGLMLNKNYQPILAPGHRIFMEYEWGKRHTPHRVFSSGRMRRSSFVNYRNPCLKHFCYTELLVVFIKHFYKLKHFGCGKQGCGHC